MDINHEPLKQSLYERWGAQTHTHIRETLSTLSSLPSFLNHSFRLCPPTMDSLLIHIEFTNLQILEFIVLT